jgi:hypothetical protein
LKADAHEQLLGVEIARVLGFYWLDQLASRFGRQRRSEELVGGEQLIKVGRKMEGPHEKWGEQVEELDEEEDQVQTEGNLKVNLKCFFC